MHHNIFFFISMKLGIITNTLPECHKKRREDAGYSVLPPCYIFWRCVDITKNVSKLDRETA